MKKHDAQTATCQRCQTVFTFTWPHTRSKFCSLKCMKAAWRDRHRERLRAAQKVYISKHRERRRETLRKYHAGRGKQTAIKWRARNWPRLSAEILARYHSDPIYKSRQNSRLVANKKLKQSDRLYECEGCGSTKRLHCHHINLNPLDNQLENLMWLCHWCHMRIHAEIREKTDRI